MSSCFLILHHPAVCRFFHNSTNIKSRSADVPDSTPALTFLEKTEGGDCNDLVNRIYSQQNLNERKGRYEHNND